MKMKVLKINGFFKLSDDFEGDYPEAVQELANYMKNNRDKRKIKIPRDEDMADNPDYIFANFLETVLKGQRFQANASLTEWDENKKEWKDIKGG